MESNNPLYQYTAETAPMEDRHSIHKLLLSVNESISRSHKKHGMPSRLAALYTSHRPDGGGLEYIAVLEHPYLNVEYPED